MRFRIGSALIALAAAGQAEAQSAPSPRSPASWTDYRQPAAVAERFPNVPIALDAPALKPGASGFTGQEELEAFLTGLERRAPHMRRSSLGRTPQGRDLPLLVFTREGLSDPAAVRRLNRPVIWLIGQQHGDEPAGGEAMLALAAALADGELKPLLDRITVVIVPRANPDGAAAFTRRTSADFDLNRDHLVAALPETRMIQAAMAQLPPDVVVDAHEYGAGGFLRSHGVLSPWDGTFLESTNASVPEATKAATRDLFRPAIEAKLARHGLTNHDYLTGSSGGVVSTGGSAAGIGRNYYGLVGAVAFLLETRVPPYRDAADARQAFQRRVATHYVFASAALETAAREPARVRRTAAQARRQLARSKEDLVIDAEMPEAPREIVFMDPTTGEPKPLTVRFRDGRGLTPTRTRPRPRGYVLDGSATAALEAFRAKGVLLCPLAASPFEAEAFRVTLKAPITRASREAINPEETAAVVLDRRTVATGAGAVYVPMAQTHAAVVAAALEPDSAGSFVSTGLVPLTATREPPFWRVPHDAPRPKLAAGAPAGCRR
jgi:hypothetical protein